MRYFQSFLWAASASVLSITAVSAHALLDHAVPGVGATVTASPNEIRLTFSQEVVPAFSEVQITTAQGGGLAAGKTAGEGDTLRLRLNRPLTPGVYTVHWRVVSVDTHVTSGSYRFTVAP